MSVGTLCDMTGVMDRMQTLQNAKHFEASQSRMTGFAHVLLITTGSVASVKAPLIVEQLLRVRVNLLE